MFLKIKLILNENVTSLVLGPATGEKLENCNVKKRGQHNNFGMKLPKNIKQCYIQI